MGSIVSLWFESAVRCYIEGINSSGGWTFIKNYEEVDHRDYYKSDRDILYLKPPAINSDIEYKELVRARLFAYITDETDTRRPAFWVIQSPWEISDITVGSKYPERSSNSIQTAGLSSPSTWVMTDYLDVEDMFRVINYGAILGPNSCTTWTPVSDAGPYIELELSEIVGLIVSPIYPTEGATISKSLPTTFQWNSEAKSLNTISQVKLSYCTFRWRYLGESGINEIPLSNVFEVTLPAGTFQTGTIEWQIEVRSNSGVTTTSEWMQVEVSEPLSTPKGLSPRTIVDGSKIIYFEWEHVISNGTEQTAYELEISYDLQQWDLVASGQTNEAKSEIPGGVLKSGAVYWRVRTANSEGNFGNWSEPVRFLVVSAPATPSVTVVDASPRFSIRWHQTDQQGYEIMLDDILIAQNYGEESHYVYDDYIDNGTHTVMVRIQNRFGMWSNWGTALLNIVATDEPEISLSVNVQTHVVNISWKTNGSYDRFLIYRNGKNIAEVATQSFTDQFASGVSEYQIRGIYNESGRCGLSEKIEIFVEVSSLMICDVYHKNWIFLSKSLSSLRTTTLSKLHRATYNHFVGKTLPSADIGEAEYHTLSLDCAWNNSDLTQAYLFEALLGKVVAIKTVAGKSIFAVFDSLSKDENRFWTSYNAQLTPVDWEEGRL